MRASSPPASLARHRQLEVGRVADAPAQALAAAMAAMTQQLCGLQATMHELW